MKTSHTRHFCYLLFCALSLVPFHVPFATWMRLALDDPRYSLVLAIPFLSLALCYFRRRTIFQAPEFSPRAAAPLLLAAAALGFAAAPRHNLNLSMLALVLTWIAGFTLVYGARPLRAALFPLLFLLLMVPLPAPILEAWTRMLQAGSAEWTWRLFRLLDIPVVRDGFQFALPHVTVEVAEQCSSIRSSTALLITSLVVGYLFLRSPWRRMCLSLTAFPIAMFTNGIRIVTLSALAVYVDPAYLEGHLHHDGGALFSLISVILLLVLVYFLQVCRVGFSLRRASARQTMVLPLQ